VLHSQVDVHALYGGVVPELASRDHVKRLIPLYQELLQKTGLSAQSLDGVAYTAGPGLAGALLTGAQFARALAFALDVPALGVHHMEGHLLAPMLEEEPPEFPFVCLLVSGGHTLLVDVTGIGDYRILGESIDDAAGEAFDKTAKVLGLPYPGGPHLAALAENGNAAAVKLPRPMLDRPGMDFSFSGLKTATIVKHRYWQANEEPDRQEETAWMADLAASFEEAVVDTLARKCERALEATGHDRLVISGGVSANRRLRARVDELCRVRGGQAFYPALEFCTDNGAMIALAGALRIQRGQRDNSEGWRIMPRWPLDDLAPV